MKKKKKHEPNEWKAMQRVIDAQAKQIAKIEKTCIALCEALTEKVSAERMREVLGAKRKKKKRS